ncbi:peptidase S41-like protein [Luteibacter rhizovicinus]|uniref:Peptidase S41-like protein n=1 Tax=Luteibacter rhizovicinus TaxID=242606 RepID=A0A4R3YHH0_9GAMM|nr:S41 family peptidase [Luteibacter rhizovicinus]TCV92055.1 peptidase S41-like protein [Luteibacter rhizovicinus]
MLRRVAALFLLAPALAAAQTADRDWAQALRQDATALHDDVAANHPGPVDPLNPRFATANDAGLAMALDRAKRTKDFAGYWYAMRAYAAGFDDGHLNFSEAKGTKVPVMASRWPGFLTAFDNEGKQRVVTRDDRAPLPLDATLLACDGRPADRLAAENVGAFTGRWNLKAQRAWAGGRLFLDNGNPWIARPSVCTFDVAGEQRSITLTWIPIDQAALKERLAATSRRAHDPIGMRKLPDGTIWLALSDFDGDPSGAAAKALVPLIADLAKQRDAIVAAPAIVLDLRGNNGGSSDWSLQIARALWGAAHVDAANVDSTTVEWRASAANIATMSELADKLRASPDGSHEVLAWVDGTVAGMTAAKKNGQALWQAPKEAEAKSAAQAPVAPPRARIFMVTDAGCGSACLDAADLWLALGVIHVGEETSADTLYMDIRKDDLPSGVGRVVVPMKVYRGRKRGANVPIVPAHIFPGTVADTPALERWIATLH